MSKKTKVRVILAGVLAVVLIIAYFVIIQNYKEPVVEVPIVCPEGALTDSLFDYQNMRGELTNDALKFEDNFESVPINVALPNSTRAVSGGANFYVMGDNYIFTYEMTDEEVLSCEVDTRDIYKNQITNIISSNAKPEKTIMNYISPGEYGYLNGCQVIASTYEIKVDGVKDTYYAVIFYCTPCEDLNVDHRIHLIVGCVGMGSDETFMQERYDNVVSLVRSFKLNNKYVDPNAKNYFGR